jgi:hypothetical protein
VSPPCRHKGASLFQWPVLPARQDCDPTWEITNEETAAGFGRALALSGAASAEDVKLGILIGFTGPIESLTGHMAMRLKLAMAEVNASGKAAKTPTSRCAATRPASTRRRPPRRPNV